MSSFLKALHSGRVLLMDGAMGTELLRAGLSPGDNATAWNVLHPKRVRAVHDAYRQAGAEVLLTNTFMGNAEKSPHDTQGAGGMTSADYLNVWKKACSLMGPAGAPIFRLLCLGPIAGNSMEREYDRTGYFTHSNLWIGADGVLLETCSSPRVRYALANLHRAWQGPVLLSLAFERNAAGDIVTHSGHPPEWFARRTKQYGIDALGVNCGRDIGMDEVIAIIQRFRQTTDVPLFARPNAGTPKKVKNRWVYPLTPAALAGKLPALLEAGVAMVGGCCGTTPKHIAAMRPILDNWNA
jgi:5-methyltetrahydrofolate--homocysteine methyltransferase